jgi:hypothetical protein
MSAKKNYVERKGPSEIPFLIYSISDGHRHAVVPTSIDGLISFFFHGQVVDSFIDNLRTVESQRLKERAFKLSRVTFKNSQARHVVPENSPMVSSGGPVTRDLSDISGLYVELN